MPYKLVKNHPPLSLLLLGSTHVLSKTPVDIIWNKMSGNLKFLRTPTHFIPYVVLWCSGHQILDRKFNSLSLLLLLLGLGYKLWDESWI